jgi:hypothetical protein
MKLDDLQNYYVDQRFIIQFSDDLGDEVFELTITGIDLDDEAIYDDIHCDYRYLESPVYKGKAGSIQYTRCELDSLISDCWYQWNDWGFLGWLPIKPLNKLPEELFVI